MSLFAGTSPLEAAIRAQQQSQQAAIQAHPFGAQSGILGSFGGGLTWDDVERREAAIRQGQKASEKPMTFYTALKTEIKEWLKITI